MTGPLKRPATRARRYGWIPDLPDRRDWRYVRPKQVHRLPARVDLRMGCSPVEDQGDLGSCTAQALAGALEFLERRKAKSFQDRSRLFIYYNERVITRTTHEDSGAMLRDGIKTLVQQGACGEQRWPYIVKNFKMKPPAACYTEGREHQITAYRRIESLQAMKACLADGFPFVFGFTVYESLETRTVARTGRIPMPGRRERAVGGHAVMAVGYDEKTESFFIRNSWGAGWGDHGYGTLPYAYLDSRDLSDDFWTIRSGEGF